MTQEIEKSVADLIGKMHNETQKFFGSFDEDLQKRLRLQAEIDRILGRRI